MLFFNSDTVVNQTPQCNDMFIGNPRAIKTSQMPIKPNPRELTYIWSENSHGGKKEENNKTPNCKLFFCASGGKL